MKTENEKKMEEHDRIWNAAILAAMNHLKQNYVAPKVLIKMLEDLKK